MWVRKSKRQPYDRVATNQAKSLFTDFAVLGLATALPVPPGANATNSPWTLTEAGRALLHTLRLERLEAGLEATEPVEEPPDDKDSPLPPK